MVTHTPGVGQGYLGAQRNREGRPFDRSRAYQLVVQANVPVKRCGLSLGALRPSMEVECKEIWAGQQINVVSGEH